MQNISTNAETDQVLEPEENPLSTHVARHVARVVLATFILTFIASRVMVILIMDQKVPDFFFHVGKTHVHHLNYGIFMLCGVGAYLLFFQPRGHWLIAAAAIYGVGLGLTFDEFGMWLHLGGSYWQRGSFDAVVVVAALLGLVAVAPEFKKFGPGHWTATIGVAALTFVFGVLLVHSIRREGAKIMPRLQQIEQTEPG